MSTQFIRLNHFENIVNKITEDYINAISVDLPSNTDNFETTIEESKNDDAPVIEVSTTKVLSSTFICADPRSYFVDKKELNNFNSGDGLILPESSGTRLLNSMMKIYTVKLANTLLKDLVTYGRVVAFDAPDRHVIMPEWMMDVIGVNCGDKIDIDTIKTDQISKIKFKVPTEIADPKSVLEFELRNHVLSYIGKQIQVKIFDKKFNIVVTDQSPLYVGIISNKDIELEIE